MPVKDHHGKPYDATTQAKLQLFEKYTEAWLPTFLKADRDDVIYIVDYFAGPGGYDANGVPSSPQRIMKAVGSQKKNLATSSVKVRVIFNEFKPEKHKKLKRFIDGWLELDKDMVGSVEVLNMDFVECFEHVLNTLPPKAPSLQILDQNGVKFGNEQIVDRLCHRYKTDFLLFISTFTLSRFITQDSILRHFPKVGPVLVDAPVQVMHQTLAKGFEELVCPGRQFIPFALKRGANYFGVIFSSEHPRGPDKFLRQAWSMDEETGQANYILPEQRGVGQFDIFTGLPKLSKIETYERDLLEWIAKRGTVTNEEVFHFTQNRGFTGTHSREALQAAKKARKLTYAGTSPKTRYETALGQEKDLVTITYTP